MEKLKKKRLFVMVGIPGSGKSTFIRTHIDHFDKQLKLVTRDTIRFNLVSEDEEYFSKEDKVYEEFIRRIKKNLNDPNVNDVIADATHLSKGSRRKLFYNLGKSLKNIEVIALVLNTPLEICLVRNANRTGRERVPEESIRNMAKAFRIPKLDEGFDKIYIFDVDGVIKEIVREE